MISVEDVAASMRYMERKWLRRMSRDQKNPFEGVWRMVELGLAQRNEDDPHRGLLTDRGKQVLEIIDGDEAEW